MIIRLFRSFLNHHCVAWWTTEIWSQNWAFKYHLTKTLLSDMEWWLMFICNLRSLFSFVRIIISIRSRLHVFAQF